ncbi:uncharacterized protein LOC122312616 [Carya illinoinensis]|uniref:uncharacterized protein LOC122312616 n=1 Tax=Carya illinoinensis TaxID=32201 RepID=UPI001C729414|nr:uncharacterized protein LOC122312616 [Carya illinoinensis]
MKKKNCIKGIKDSSGRWQVNEARDRVITEYFQTLFATAEELGNMDFLQDLNGKVDAQMVEQLDATFTAEEVKRALDKMHPTKAPRSNGMASIFYQKFWSIVGTNITDAMLKALNIGSFPFEINHTFITLIPKKKLPELVSNYRPISLYNVIYKLISKVLANRLKLVLPTVISPSQTAFVPGRLITDNVLVAYEMVHFLRRKRSGKDGFMSLRLDMSKAYDQIEWKFFEEVMRQMGFSSRWIQLVMFCVTTIKGIQVCRGAPKLNHLLFADDSVLFCKANMQTYLVLQHRLDIYEKASGQKINRAKTFIVFSHNVPLAQKMEITQFWGVTFQQYEKYLGLPPMVGRGLMASFWCDQKQEERKLSWISWRRMCESKMEGGMGFKSIQIFNKVLLAKQGWRIMHEESSLLYKIFKARYFPTTSFIESRIGVNPSYVWRGIWEIKNNLLKGCRWRVGNGLSINIWTDYWLPKQKLLSTVVNVPPETRLQLVSSLMMPEQNSWDIEKVRSVLPAREANEVLSIRFPIDKIPADILISEHEMSGIFSVKSAYDFFKSLEHNRDEDESFRAEDEKLLWKHPWKMHVPQRVKVFAWRVCFPFHNTSNSQDAVYAISYWNRRIRGVFPSCMGNLRPRRKQKYKRHWQPPPEGVLKLNIDGALFSDQCKAGVGAVLRDNEGDVIFAASKSEPDIAYSLEIEFLTILRGLQLCMSLGITKLRVESDSLLVVQELEKEGYSTT